MTATTPSPLDRARGCLLGLAAGDAVGTTVEFCARGTFAPLTDMVGGGPFQLQAGEWTDDTSLAVCLAQSLVECRGFDARDQAQRYLAWADTGKPGPRDHCFDIGGTTREAVEGFRSSGEPMSGPTSPNSAGNGSLMRLAPVPIFYAKDVAAAIEYAGESSRVTHGADEAVDACRAYAAMLVAALRGEARDSILEPGPVSGPAGSAISPRVSEVMNGSWRGKDASEIKGSGYVVPALEAAIWCFATIENYREAVLCAANLGDDADTTAAICGQLAGAYYGAAGIPDAWLEKLFMRDEIEALAGELHRLGAEA